jgi:hypothetical protein
MTRILVTAVFLAGLNWALLAQPVLAQEIEVVDLTGIDTHHITLRARVDQGKLVLTGKLNRRTLAGDASETLPGALILKITLEDAQGVRIDSREITIPSHQLGLALDQPIGEMLPRLARLRVERVTPAEIQRRLAASDAKRARDREAAIRARDWPRAVQDRVVRGDVWVGMTTDQARMSRGEPFRITETITANGRDELWIYTDQSLSLHFRNGTLAVIQRTR